MADKNTLLRIKKLHPKVRDEVSSLVDKVNEQLKGRAKIIIVQGFRTPEEQDALYAQGRTKPGKKVTNAKKWQSIHNYGLAIDFAMLVDGKEISWDTKADWDGDKQADWMEVVAIFRAAGWSWGGDWISLKDLPHLEKTFGEKWETLKDKYDSGKKFIQDKIEYVIL